MNFYLQQEQRIDDLKKDMSVGVSHILDMYGSEHARVDAKLRAFNPRAILERGYSITVAASSGAIIKDALALKKGDSVETTLGKGKFRSRVEEISK
jgi:exodeoxyribonuclease VII large subunit